MNEHQPALTADTIASRLRDFYTRIDARAGELVALHGGRLRCGRGCSGCCVDDLTVFTVEADNIRRSYPDLCAAGAPHPPGVCAFLDNNGLCRIYDARPYVCRTQGLPLHWIEETGDGTAVAMRDICPENDAGTPVVELAESDCWIVGPAESELSRMQFEISGGDMARFRLRDLFSVDMRRQ